MKRYRRGGGFARLMYISCALSVVRLAFLGASAILFLACKSYGAAAAALAVSLAAGLGAFLLIHRCGLASVCSRTLEILADCCTKLTLLACLALRLRWTRIPAGILSLLSLLGLTGKIYRLRQPVV